MSGRLIRVAEAAERLGVSDSLVYELCAAGQIAHVRLGKPGKRGAIRIGESDLEEFLNGRRVEAPDDSAYRRHVR